mgnify:CR=1 FL=1
MKGLLNLGNSCYFNSCIQCLFQAPAISNSFLTNPYDGDCEFTKEYCNLLKLFWFEKKTMTMDPGKLLKIFKKKFKQFDNSREQDAHEAMLCVIDILEKARPEIKDSLYGSIQKTVIYPGGKSVTEEKFAVLMLTPKKTTTIQELLKEHFSQQEVLQGYTDDSGKTHHCAVLTQKISKFPPIFIVGFNMFRGKHRIQITEKMNNFRLFAVCTHMGSMNGGHYIAHTKHRGIWYLKDDDIITKNAPMPVAGPFYFCLFKSTNS